MESTGKYWIPIFNVLEDDINVYLTHLNQFTEIPGISTLSAILIISEIDIDMTQLESDKQLLSWACS